MGRLFTLFRDRKRMLYVLLVFIFFLSPIAVGVIVSVPARIWLTTNNNDWIGFFGNYIGGIFGAGIGGYIAYKIASSEFEKKRIVEIKDKQIEVKLNYLSKLIAAVVALKQALYFDFSSVINTYGFLRGKSEAIHQIARDAAVLIDPIIADYSSYKLEIDRNRKRLNNELERFQMEYQISDVFLDNETIKFIVKQGILLDYLYESDLFLNQLSVWLNGNFTKYNEARIKRYEERAGEIRILETSGMDRIDELIELIKIEVKQQLQLAT